MQSETDILQDEAKVLRRRLQAMKLACKNSNETIKTLNQEIKEADASLCSRRERLSELSIDADTAVLSSNNAAQLLIRDLLSNDSGLIVDTRSVDSCSKELAALRSQILHAQEDQVRQINAFQIALPSADDVNKEISRLESVAISPEALMDMALVQELEILCEKLALGDADDGRKILRSLIEEGEEVSVVDEAIGDVRTLLERAWLADQVAILRTQGEIMATTIAEFEEKLIPPMKELYQNLALSDSRVHEAEALISALIEEVEEIVDDVQEVKNASTKFSNGESSSTEDAVLESQVKELIVRLNKHRSSDGASLVLLDKNDIILHLQRTEDRLQCAMAKEMEWTTSLPEKLNEVTHGHSTLLSAVYNNSAVNTSPPFNVSPQIAHLAQEAGQRAAVLGSDIDRFTKENPLDERKEQKLKAFVDKWTNTR
ncbi:hypothetical protein NEOLEDRAFT_649762 [Neolentinus lepideus HHB14362 ss-1]|uniref:Uncharacterized protein n=1 Tax=Neolentinus lepideus HHB14362 ss-1 TaxID=1314782 RepID=A0A165QIQ0_9AGAM|nr:hypothetical protein NEOLEDRAFT_649762 [Neolentinus lepideus HHB14362 ss-1]